MSPSGWLKLRTLGFEGTAKGFTTITPGHIWEFPKIGDPNIVP